MTFINGLPRRGRGAGGRIDDVKKTYADVSGRWFYEFFQGRRPQVGVDNRRIKYLNQHKYQHRLVYKYFHE